MTQNGIIVLLFIIGLMAIVVDMLVVGMVIGIMGFALCMISIAMAFHAGNATLGWTLVLTGIILTPGMVFLWFKIFTSYISVQTSEQGYTASKSEDKDLVGAEGVSLTTLRPAGTARFGDRRVDVMADGEMINKDTRIKVIRVEGNRVLVRSVKA